MATNEEDRAPRPKTDVAENRKNGPILSVKSTHPSKVPASASAKRLLSLLDGPEKPRGYGGRGATTKRPRTEVARPPSAAASNPASKNSFSLLPFRANPNDASSRPKNVLDIYAAAMLPPSRQPAAAAAARPKPRQEGRQSSTNAHAFASNPQQIVQFQSKVNATTETSKSVSTVTPHSNAPLLARTSTTTTSRQLPSHIVAKLQKNSMKPTKHCVDSSEASRGRDHARNVAVSFAPTTRSVDATSRERTTFVAVDDTSKRVPPSIGMAGFRNRPKVSAPTRFVDRQNAPKDLRELPPSSAMDRPPLGNDSSANDQGATQDLAGSDPSATEILVSLSEQPPPGRWEAAPATLASTLTIPKLNRDIDGGSATGRKTKPKKGTDNFVRLNLKNSSGSCRGKRNVRRSKWRVAMSERGAYSRTTSVHVPQESFVSTTDLMDPVDDFLDGVYSPENDEDPGSQSGSSSSRVQSSNAKQQRQRKLNASCQIPNCRVHNRPCKLCTVKKTSNKGRKFWVCSLPREEQCQHFQWAEDSQQVRVASSYPSRPRTFFLYSLPSLACPSICCCYHRQRSWRCSETRNSPALLRGGWLRTCTALPSLRFPSFESGWIDAVSPTRAPRTRPSSRPKSRSGFATRSQALYPNAKRSKKNRIASPPSRRRTHKP
jgi:GRF zinc finger